MNLKNYYWYFNGVLSDKFCNDLIKYGNEKQEQLALIGGFTEKSEKEPLNEKDIADLKKKRDSSVVWLDDAWIYREIQPYIHQANASSGWNFEWDYSESCQFTKYKKNQYYDWHCDSWPDPYPENKGENFKGKIRKLSVTCQLTDESEYEGGKLEFQFRNGDDPKIIEECKHAGKKGSIIVFPSFVWHRVTPVTKGDRYSLVIWNVGQPHK
tara:strand:+ start:338 stop:970 length:633 start_codon:yes stop_codon:yes gene_type:complete